MDLQQQRWAALHSSQHSLMNGSRHSMVSLPGNLGGFSVGASVERGLMDDRRHSFMSLPINLWVAAAAVATAAERNTNLTWLLRQMPDGDLLQQASEIGVGQSAALQSRIERNRLEQSLVEAQVLRSGLRRFQGGGLRGNTGSRADLDAIDRAHAEAAVARKFSTLTESASAAAAQRLSSLSENTAAATSRRFSLPELIAGRKESRQVLPPGWRRRGSPRTSVASGTPLVTATATTSIRLLPFRAAPRAMQQITQQTISGMAPRTMALSCLPLRRETQREPPPARAIRRWTTSSPSSSPWLSRGCRSSNPSPLTCCQLEEIP